MRRPLPRSFRRLLILRLLLLGIPILLIGQYVTLRKARTGLLETARQNLMSSAVRKSASLAQATELMISQIQLLTQTHALKAGTPVEIETLIQQFAQDRSLADTCIQVMDSSATTIIHTTCALPASPTIRGALPWSASTTQQLNNFVLLDVTATREAARSQLVDTGDLVPENSAHITLRWAAPVYAFDETLRYTVILQSTLSQLENVAARSLVGYTVLLDEAGTVRIHPETDQASQSIRSLGDAKRLQTILRNAQSGRQATIHLFKFSPDHSEWLAGYSSLNLAIAPGQQQQWVLLAVAPLEHALQGLADIRNVLILWTLGLLMAQVLLILYLAQRLSQPVERLCQYAYKIQDLSHFREMPQDFQVWEFDHLARVFNKMMKRLEQRADELRHAWQDAQMANQLKSEFLANTSHELRTPLNAIIGCIRLVKDDCCDSKEEIDDFLETADQAAIHLLGIINDILDIAKIESGTLALKTTLIDIRPLVEEVIDLEALQIQQKGLVLNCFQPQDPLMARVDPAKLKQVLLNIIYNAVKFTDCGVIKIETRLQLAEQPEFSWFNDSEASIPYPRIMVSVSDTGIGIAPSQQEKLFRPFVMADGSTTRQYEGTGLGLAISRNLIRLMHGGIMLHSEGINRGTQVIFALPFVGSEANTQQAVSARRPSAQTLAVSSSQATETSPPRVRH